MDTPAGIHWLRVLFAGFLAEVLVIALVIPPALLVGKNTLTYTAPLASLVACFAFAVWVGRRIDSRFVLHGILVGVVATLIYVALTRGGPEPPAYLVAHALKLLGGAAGGLVAARRQKPAQQLDTTAGETPRP
jgi:putative membrane protein (TIGR04086 family)